MSQIPELMGGRRLSHDAVSDKGWYTRGVGDRVQIFSDFIGGGSLPLDSAGGEGFVNHDTSSSGAPTLAFQSAANGVYRMQFASTSEAEYLATYLGDAVCVPPTAKAVWECRIAITGTFSADDRVVFGLASARNNTLDNIADHVWFRMEGANNNILVEGDDDGTTDNDDNDTGVDWTSGVMMVLKIDMSDLTNVLFYIDGALVKLASGEKIDVSGMAGSDLLQPFIEIQKDAGTVEHQVDVDYISVLWGRG